MTNPTASDSNWAAGLSPEQRKAAAHQGSNARLLAGPGTGKTWTLTARVRYLVFASAVDPESIMALTFTRAAAGELKDRVNKALEGKIAGRPTIATLHSFALRVLLANAKRLDALPQPLRIADDWEERNIIQEDLKALTKSTVKTVRKNFQALSADWDTLRADDNTPNPLRADASFVGAWQGHRVMYGYTLRAELVYQLKRALEQRTDIALPGDLRHLLVDEYQDLNACDLNVIGRIAANGVVLYAAGDDDQNIYGFRHANPEGIRRFDKDHAPSADLALATCVRCDRDIMELARFVADLDVRRLAKPWIPRGDAGPGDVRLLRFNSGSEESAGVATLCRYLIDEEKLEPDDILVLIRSDQNGAFSTPLTEAMTAAGVPFSVNVGSESPLDLPPGRIMLGMIRLAINPDDSLAWRTLLTVRTNGVGNKTIGAIVESASSAGVTFAQGLKNAVQRPDCPLKLASEFAALSKMVDEIRAVIGDATSVLSADQLRDAIVAISRIVTRGNVDGIDEAAAYIATKARRGEIDSFEGLLSSLSIASQLTEQELVPGAVNMLTMHKAKGLTAKAVIVMACEDQYLPGRQQSVDQEGDERRLLYVSLTRARQKLVITYAQRRHGQQQHTGRDSGHLRRTLTRYLRDAQLRVTPAADYLANLAKE